MITNKKNPAAVSLGRRGGSKNTPAQQAARAKQSGAASRERWRVYYERHPEKLRERLEREAKRKARK